MRHDSSAKYRELDDYDLEYLGKTKGEDFIEDCTVQYIGPIYSTLLVEGGSQ
jgi:hypothetical protein